ncbi:MAG TPA: hypothetical protein VE263_00235 [Candidatus Angelobacter sp.]|nr:hypothetical protein [Candidatus Angelobacter sp.]
MTDKQEMQLVAPLILSGVFFILLSLIWRGIGDLNRYTWKALLASAGLIAYALYLTMWQNEIIVLWNSFPLVVVFGALLSLIVPCGLFYWIWRVQVAAKAEKTPAASESIKTGTSSRRLFNGVVLAWGVVNLLGLLIAIIHAFLRRP